MSAQLVSSAISSGILSVQFEQLRELQDESNPDFISGLIALYFEDAAKKLKQMREMISGAPVDFSALDSTVHQLKGSSASFGAAEMTNLCISMREYGRNNDAAGCQTELGKMEEAFGRLHRTLEEYSRLEAVRRGRRGQ